MQTNMRGDSRTVKLITGMQCKYYPTWQVTLSYITLFH